jgi:hypothetical protein
MVAAGLPHPPEPLHPRIWPAVAPSQDLWGPRKVEVAPAEETVNWVESVALAAQFGFTATELLVLIRNGRLRPRPQASLPDLSAIRFPRRHQQWSLRRSHRRPWRG